MDNRHSIKTVGANMHVRTVITCKLHQLNTKKLFANNKTLFVLVCKNVKSSFTCVAILEVGCNDLLLAATWKLLLPGDLHHFFLSFYIIMTWKPGLRFCQGAQEGDGFKRLHKAPLNKRHCREKRIGISDRSREMQISGIMYVKPNYFTFKAPF